MEKKVVNIKRYSLEIKSYDDDSSQMVVKNEGFEKLELVGVLALAQKHAIDALENGNSSDKPNKKTK